MLKTKRSQIIYLTAVFAMIFFPFSVSYAQNTFETELSKYFGFASMEIYKGSAMASSLKHSDVNGDGRLDITYIDHEKSQIVIMLGGVAPDTAEMEINSIGYDKNFRAVYVPLEKNVYDYEFVKLAGDTRESLLFMAEPRTLLLYRQLENMRFSEYSRATLEESNFSNAVMSRKDMNSDSLEDVVLMCPDFFVILYNRKFKDFLNEPVVIPITGEYGCAPSEFSLYDINSDGFEDIIYSYSGKTGSLRARYGRADGNFLNEESFELLNFGNIDFYTAKDAGKNSSSIYMPCVLENSNKLFVYRIIKEQGGGSESGDKMNTTYFSKEDKNARQIFTKGDFDGDGLEDLLVANPNHGKAAVYYCGTDGLVKRQADFSFPVSASSVFTAADSDETELFAWAPGKLMRGSFKKIDGKYNFLSQISEAAGTIGAAPVNIGGKDFVAALVRESGEIFLKRFTPAGSMSHEAPVKVNSVLDNLTAMDIVSSNGGDIWAFIVFQKYDSPQILVKGKNGQFAQAFFSDKVTASSLTRKNCFPCDTDVDGTNEIVWLDKNLIRIYKIDDSNMSISQKDQINMVPDDFVAGSGACEGRKIYALDASGKRMIKADVKERKVSLIELDRKSSDASVLIMNGRPAFVGESEFSALSRKPALRFEPHNVSRYEEINKGKYNNLKVADVNGDKISDIVMTCGAQNYLDIFTALPDRVRHAFRFKIFNTKQFHGSSYSNEPQQLDVFDANGDGVNDILMQTHDRIIVYYSEGPAGNNKNIKS
ncbi:MAG TPA: hypothetical protein PKK26_11185, partial [Candidatus Wallbacteria bacterium]|nr:hypothetical protein [Candidatus Wallbacteria bacterium]